MEKVVPFMYTELHCNSASELPDDLYLAKEDVEEPTYRD